MAFAAFQLTVCLGGLLQRESPADGDPESSLRNPVLEVAASPPPAFGRVGSKPESADPEAPFIQLVKVERSGWAAGLAEIHQVAVAGQDREAIAASGLTDRIEHRIDAPAFCGVAD